MKSETAICEPDCHKTQFISGNPLQTTFNIGNCRFIADYYIRKTCSIWCDILLWRVRIIDPPPCDSYDINQLLNIAAAKIMEHFINSNEFENITGQPACRPNGPGDCTTYWRVSKASCWKKFTNPNFNPNQPASSSNYYGGISYCYYDICCLTWYRICYNEYMQLVITEIEHNSTQNCPYDPSGQCVPVCD